MKNPVNIFSILLLLIFLTACQEKDAAYYRKNIDEAEQKLQKCYDKAQAQNPDTTFVKYTEKDCLAASQVIVEIQAEKAQKQFEAEQAQRKAEERRKREAAEIRFKAEFGTLSWQKLLSAFKTSECNQGILGEQPSMFCQYFLDKVNAAYETGISEMRQTAIPELLKQQQRYCKLNLSEFTVCEVWQIAVNRASQDYFSDKGLDDILDLESSYCNADTKHTKVCDTWSELAKEKTQLFAKTKDLEFLGNAISNDKYCKKSRQRKYAVCNELIRQHKNQRSNFRNQLQNDDNLFVQEYKKCRKFYLSLPDEKGGLPSMREKNKFGKVKNHQFCRYVSEAAYLRKMGKSFYEFREDL